MGKRGKEVGADQLLGRGSRVLGLASVASANGQRKGDGPWYVLSKETVGPAEEILSVLEQKPDPVLLEAVVRAAMSDEPATSPPPWTEPFWHGGDIIVSIGKSIDENDVAKVVGKAGDMTNPRVRGLAALAVAFCRTRDTLEALTQSFIEEDRILTLRMGALASVVVEPLEPSLMREKLRIFLGEDNEVEDG